MHAPIFSVSARFFTKWPPASHPLLGLRTRDFRRDFSPHPRAAVASESTICRPKFDEIVAKALEKDRDLRCQSAAELRADLKRLKRDGDSGRSESSVSARARVAISQSVALSESTRSPAAPNATAVIAAAPADQILRKRSHRYKVSC